MSRFLALALMSGALAMADAVIELNPRELRNAGAVAFDVTNSSEEPAVFSVEIADAAGARTSGRTTLPLAPHETAWYALALNSPAPAERGMRGEPTLPGFRLLLEDHRAIDATALASLHLRGPAGLAIEHVTKAGGIDYNKIVDRYGQFAKQDWPGKIHDDAELRAARAAEQKELQAAPVLRGRDDYGGWLWGPKLQATGYFRTAKEDGRWWLVTPNGYLFFSLGLDCVTSREGGTVVEGRESMFDWLPGKDDPLAAHFGNAGGGAPVGLKVNLVRGRTFSFYAANLERKYGADWSGEWRATTLARLRAWGFNTIANWSDPAFYEMKRVPYTVTLNVRGRLPEVAAAGDYWRHMMDVFDPKFAEAVDASVRAAAQARRDDPWCLGYFVDNELSWGNMRSDRGRFGLALGALALGPESAARRALIGQLQKHYESVEKLNAAWKTHFASWTELKPPEGELPAEMKTDLAAYMQAFAARYFRTVRDALKKYDPNHLYLGTRFAGHTREEVEACAEFCDVISFNIYRPRIDPAQWTVLDGIDKPAIIGEFHMGALDRGMFHPGLVATADQSARGQMYADYVRSVADHPLFVGCHFFKYADEPRTGRRMDGENYNIGFTTVTDSVYPEMVAAAKSVHAEVYPRRCRR